MTQSAARSTSWSAVSTAETRVGTEFSWRSYGSSKKPGVLFLHDVYGLFDSEPLLEALGDAHHVLAPNWPGYDDHPTEGRIKNMLDFTLHGWDIASAVGLLGADDRTPIRLIGHGFGAMIASEMAATCPSLVESLVLLAPLGLWVDASPLPDLFASLPFKVPGLWFMNPADGAATMFGGLDVGDPVALQRFVIANSRRLGTAGKVLFPIAERGASRRLPRITAHTTVVWGQHDRLLPIRPYADAWTSAIPGAQLVVRPDAAHALGHDGDVQALAALIGEAFQASSHCP